jgi:large subunit ribosomal protein L9
MKVILLQDVKGLGKAGQVAKTSDGYARNLLIPKGLVKEATEANVRELERQNAANAAKKAESIDTAQALAKRLEELVVTIHSKGGEGGRLFGSVTGKDVADGLKEQHGIEIDKRKFVIDTPIKQTGEHGVEIKLIGEITARLKVNVVIDKQAK